jgi:hypothetical protein
MFCLAGACCKVPCSFYWNSIAAMRYKTSVIRHNKEEEQHRFSVKTIHSKKSLWIDVLCAGTNYFSLS